VKARADLEHDEWGRLVVWLARSSWYGGQATNSAAFTSRAEAVRWAKDQADAYIDWRTWNPSASEHDYPYEKQRDNDQLTPTFRATWLQAGGGWVEVEALTVSARYDWGAR
jgi:hypothetical protein